VSLGEIPGYPLEAFINSMVSKIRRSYKIQDNWESHEDMVQTAYLAAYECERANPRASKNPYYVRRSIVNALLKSEQCTRLRRGLTISIKDL